MTRCAEKFSTPIVVHKSKLEQPIRFLPEHMSINNELLANLSVGDQVRIVIDDEHYALYTIGDVRNEENASFTRMGQQARARLDTGVPFAAVLTTAVVAQGLTDEEAKDQNEFVERLVDNGYHRGLVTIVPHGGNIELFVDKQGERVTRLLSAKGASSWICKGYKQGGGAYARWHIRSVDISCNSFPALNVIATREFSYCVKFDGMTDDGIMVGGGAPIGLRTSVRDAIAAAVSPSIEVHVAEPGDPRSGMDPENICNWLTANGDGGIQIEQSMQAREDSWAAIADAVASFFNGLI